MLMLGIEFIRWWYGPGFSRLFKLTIRRIQGIVLAFSLPLLIRTLFAPWRRIISYGGESIKERFQAMLDNLISRIVGTCVRLIVILAAVIAVILLSIVGAILLVVWPLLPAISIGLVIRGFLPW